MVSRRSVLWGAGAAAATAMLPGTGVVAAASRDPGVEVLADLSYAPRVGNAHRLDLYLPAGGGGPWPVVLWSRGSAWESDDGNTGGERVARALSGRGYAVAAVAVRSSEQARFPAQVHDGKAAVRWVRAHAGEFGLDAQRLAFMGSSSGGWLAAMVGATAGVTALEGSVGETGRSSAVDAVVDLFGPSDFGLLTRQMPEGACPDYNRAEGLSGCHDDPGSPESRLLGTPVGSDPQRVARADPGRYVSAGGPRWLLMHGTGDRTVPVGQSEVLHEALTRVGADSTFYRLQTRAHDDAFLDETAGHTGRQVLSSSAGGSREVQAGPATWSAVADFLDRALPARLG
nr:alpha/beta hydrolase [Saccharopolyspora sp. HNM0983]